MVQVVPVEKSYKVFTYRIYRQFTQQFATQWSAKKSDK